MKRLMSVLALSAVLASTSVITATPAHAYAITREEMRTLPWYRLSGIQLIGRLIYGT